MLDICDLTVSLCTSCALVLFVFNGFILAYFETMAYFPNKVMV